MAVTDAHPPAPRPAPEAPPGGARAGEHASLGELLNNLTDDVQLLFRQEIELAKAEMREEAVKAGKAAGLLGAAGFAGYMTAVLLSFTLVFALAHLIGLAWAALVITLLWAVAGGVLFALGRSRARQVDPKPERTVQTLKEDARWARHPTR
ncbi:phage holin family protein [Allonocardiopsis opalescens]|uniref:Putative superfamily III holin-X n=1 Tax=Allonocardiopsis opalescens TaxID=1144618 RepID=A0A2T0PTN2_9ACTN|nr:phage holin family protein [Allonocardiopsis opalescens]PRX92257.1 putative superfamily III holin-X [Allonocardiopsis opalescens]